MWQLWLLLCLVVVSLVVAFQINIIYYTHNYCTLITNIIIIITTTIILTLINTI